MEADFCLHMYGIHRAFADDRALKTPEYFC